MNNAREQESIECDDRGQHNSTGETCDDNDACVVGGPTDESGMPASKKGIRQKIPPVSELYVYFVALMCGISLMMPINSVFSAPNYIMQYYRFAMHDPDAKPQYVNFWVNVMTYYNLIGLVTCLVIEPFTLTKTFRGVPMLVRLLGGLAVLMVEIMIVMLVPTRPTTEAGAVASICIAGFLGGTGKSVFESTVYGLFGAFPPSFASTMMGGVGISGALTSLIQIIIKASIPGDYNGTKRQAYIYYGLDLGIQGVTFVLLVLLRFNSFARQHFGDLGGVKSKLDLGNLQPGVARDEFDDVDVEPGHNGGDEDDLARKEEAVSEDNVVLQGEGVYDNGARGEGGDVENAQEMLDGTGEPPSSTDIIRATRILPVMKAIWPMFISCGFSFFITLMLFPTIVIFADLADYWYATIVVFIFNLCDALGRFTPSLKVTWPKTYGQRWIIFGCSLARVVFLPLLLIQSYHYINSHAYGYVMMVIFGLSNGYISSMSMVLGPKSRGIDNDGKRFVAGTLMGISILVGATAGTALSIMIQTVRENAGN